ncbi:methyltransferase domain-containing protein [uncultured Hyphomonas sp.]|uniref:class I SAM-dependent methyltransferase n=1 Tax=uncultured Hyphomonas sp. TaxID=225298 RepID=UPI000C3FB1CB|nr:methyltransferase type 11 [Hyphomonadaceae bacterium]MBA27355.1 methyltransferase type 11 [Hyphomonadaceae bacterium]|tara:strand:- start:33470 stop:34213 length:744 start_codon:yes stop_codon:yes gene_type:complete
MRQDAVTLQRFYASPLGLAATRILSGKLTDLWGDARGLSLLGLGYAIPVLEAFGAAPGRSVAAIPLDHGPVSWDPFDRGNAAVAIGDVRLPFPDGMFDRVIVLHGLEESGNPRAYLREIWRITAPEGRIVLAASNRSGLWSRATRTPFGQGRPWTRAQLMNLLSIGLFQVTASSSALYMPPLATPLVASAAEGWEVMGRMLAPGLGGVVLVEAVKRLYASPGGGATAPVTEKVRLARPVTSNGRESH